MPFACPVAIGMASIKLKNCSLLFGQHSVSTAAGRAKFIFAYTVEKP